MEEEMAMKKVPWRKIAHLLTPVTKDGNIDYKRFLHRCVTAATNIFSFTLFCSLLLWPTVIITMTQQG